MHEYGHESTAKLFISQRSPGAVRDAEISNGHYIR